MSRAGRLLCAAFVAAFVAAPAGADDYKIGVLHVERILRQSAPAKAAHDRIEHRHRVPRQHRKLEQRAAEARERVVAQHAQPVTPVGVWPWPQPIDECEQRRQQERGDREHGKALARFAFDDPARLLLRQGSRGVGGVAVIRGAAVPVPKPIERPRADPATARRRRIGKRKAERELLVEPRRVRLDGRALRRIGRVEVRRSLRQADAEEAAHGRIPRIRRARRAKALAGALPTLERAGVDRHDARRAARAVHCR